VKILIIGGGIGGLTTALSLHAAGIDCEVYEKSSGIRELGVGINMLPHAVKELAALGLFDELDRVAIRTYELIYANRFGQQLWRELRGLHAGYDFPQFSIHRGKLQGLLYAAARERIGDERIHTDRELRDFEQSEDGVAATFVGRDGETKAVAHGDALIAADGIHSAVRRTLYPDEGPPTWNGVIM
jgi:5-methylphenazine-1-carboxylate 1-monooxygenase